MKWKTRSRELALLRAKYATSKYQLPFPDLATGPSCCTNGLGQTPKKSRPQYTGLAIVDTLHKQGMQVLFKSDLPYAGGRKP